MLELTVAIIQRDGTIHSEIIGKQYICIYTMYSYINKYILVQCYSCFMYTNLLLYIILNRTIIYTTAVYWCIKNNYIF